MAMDDILLAEEGNKFFGRISASGTHEIKNALAIINENAGLLEDLSSMALHQGHPLSVERIHDISRRVSKQVQRADMILKKMNRFAHSADQSIQTINLEETVCFVLELASRIIDMLEITITVTPPEFPIKVRTNLFFLQALIWRGIEAVCSIAGKEKQVAISFGNTAAPPCIWFTLKAEKEEEIKDLFGSKEDIALLAHQDVCVTSNKKKTAFGFIWPNCN